MKIQSRVLLLAALLLIAASLKAEDTGDVAIVSKARELASATTNGSAHIVALHRFVRDEIRQTATQWG